MVFWKKLDDIQYLSKDNRFLITKVSAVNDLESWQLKDTFLDVIYKSQKTLKDCQDLAEDCVMKEKKEILKRSFNTWRDPYDRGFSTCRKKEIIFEEGLTVLVGCNGSGKTTLLKNIKAELKKQQIPCLMYDNHMDGHSSHTFGPALDAGNIGFIATSLQSSEGENISINLNVLVSKLKDFLLTGETEEEKRSRELALHFNNEVKGPIETKERWILLDAIDSGYSIDNVVMFKEFINVLFDEVKNQDLHLFLVISANTYEMAAGVSCFDVMNGIPVSFEDYKGYRQFILHTAEMKDRREHQAEKKAAKPSRRRKKK